MKKYWRLLSIVLLGLVFTGLTGCVEDEASSAESMLKSATDHPAAEVPKDHPAH